MAKKHGENTAVVDEQTAQSEEIIAEEPKVKEGDKPTTTVDGVKSASPRAPRIPQNSTYRIRQGVDAGKYVGQRNCVIKALQKLASEKGEDQFFSVSEVSSHTEGLIARVPLEASVNYHLKYLSKDGLAEVKTEPTASAVQEQPTDTAAA